MNIYSKDGLLSAVKYLTKLRRLNVVKGYNSDKILVPIDGYSILESTEWDFKLYVFTSYYDRTTPLLISDLSVNDTGDAVELMITHLDSSNLPSGGLWCVVDAKNATDNYNKVIISCPLDVLT